MDDERSDHMRKPPQSKYRRIQSRNYLCSSGSIFIVPPDTSNAITLEEVRYAVYAIDENSVVEFDLCDIRALAAKKVLHFRLAHRTELREDAHYSSSEGDGLG